MQSLMKHTIVKIVLQIIALGIVVWVILPILVERSVYGALDKYYKVNVLTVYETSENGTEK